MGARLWLRATRQSPDEKGEGEELQVSDDEGQDEGTIISLDLLR